MLKDNIKNMVKTDIELTVYNLFLDVLNEYSGDKESRVELCDFIFNSLIEKASEERDYFKNL